MKEHVESRQWQGTLPKVVCITVLPGASEVRRRLRYFVSAFLSQSYEGPRELVLVYRSGDAGIAQTVKPYLDGLVIKEAVVPRTPGMRFPSAAAYHTGATRVHDADVIARWEFDEWHHPDRLSLQMRALALTTRPACILPDEPEAEDEEVSEEEADGEVSAEASFGRPGSVLGEASGMREYWSSFPTKEPLTALPDRQHTVILSMSELLVPRTAVFGAQEVVASQLRGGKDAVRGSDRPL
jgi:hypothetical protein